MLLEGKHIFIVEDNPTNLAVISTILRQNGARVTFDHWGSVTLDKMTNNEKIDLVLLDLMFPQKITGYDIYDAMQAIPELSAIPVVIVTASDPDLEMNKARTKGVNGFISKPVNRWNFPKQIAAVLAGEEVWNDEID